MPAPPVPTTPHLDDHIMGQLLQHLSLKQRMQFALVCRAWNRGAAKVTAAEGVVVSPAEERRLQSLSAWLRNWDMLSVASIQASAEATEYRLSAKPLLAILELPCSQLSALTSLCVANLQLKLVPTTAAAGPRTRSRTRAQQQGSNSRHDSGAADAPTQLAPGPAFPLVGLQRLSLSQCQVSAGDLKQLTTASSLTSFALLKHWMQSSDNKQALSPAGLQRLLEGMQHLLHLELNIYGTMGMWDDTVVKQFPPSLGSLTSLVLHGNSLALSPAALQHLEQQRLPNLLRLDLNGAILHPSCLLACPKLQSLSLKKVHFGYDLQPAEGEELDDGFGAAGHGTDHHAAHLLLPTIAKLQTLQSLEVEFDSGDFFCDHLHYDTMPYLTAPSMLTALSVTLYASLGPAIFLPHPLRPLPQLRKLETNCMVTSANCLNAIGQACVGLEHLHLHLRDCPGLEMEDVGQYLPGLVPLAPSLTALHIWTTVEPDFTSIAALTRLKVLHARISGLYDGCLHKSSIVQLTALQLTELCLHMPCPTWGTGRPEPEFRWRVPPSHGYTDIFELFRTDPQAPADMRSPVQQLLMWVETVEGECIGCQYVGEEYWSDGEGCSDEDWSSDGAETRSGDTGSVLADSGSTPS